MNAPIPHTASTQPFSKWFDVHPSLGISMMDHLFNRLDGAYPHKWRSNFPNQQAIDNWCESWAEAFEEEGITPTDVKNGLKACRSKYDWPPSCAEFIKACKPSVDPLVAYYEAVAGVQAREKGEMGEWSHPAVFWASVKVSAFDLLNQAYSTIKQRWEKALQAELDKHEWEPIPAPMLALPSLGKSQTSREQADKMVKQLNAEGVIKKTETRTNHRAWISKVLERKKAGDSTLPGISVTFAKEAMRASEA